jgi:hypothetical protein
MQKGKEVSITARCSDGSGFPSQYSRFKELLERIVSCSSSDGEVETKQLSCSANSGGIGLELAQKNVAPELGD